MLSIPWATSVATTASAAVMGEGGVAALRAVFDAMIAPTA
jgi:hypothetical protein